MATPPSEPTFEKSRFPSVAWLGKFWEVVVPFFRETAAALNRQLTFRENFSSVVLEGDARLTVTMPADPDTSCNVFIPTGSLRPALVFVVAEQVPEQGLPVDSLIQPHVEWMPASQDSQPGVRIIRLRELAPEYTYKLAVTVLGG